MKKANPKSSIPPSRLDLLEKDKIYDVLVIGGGISGAAIFWDSVLRGLDSVLVEKNDYASGTSQATSKLIHGGLRYLKNAEFALVKESLDERRILAKLTPHSIKPLGFLIPVYDYKNKYVLQIGLTLYDILSYNRNKDLSSDSMIPPHEFLNRERTISEDPNIPRANLLGSLLYYDYANINPERHTCDFIFSAKRRGGNSFNYVSVINIEKNNDIYLTTVVDSLTNRSAIIKSKSVVNSAGPWADYIDKMALKKNETHILRSKGIHIVTRNISQKHCSVRITKNKKHLFVIPWRGKTIIGTTDVSFNESPDAFSVTRQDIQNLINEINEYLNFKIEDSDVDYFYGGMRPLVDDPTESKGNTYNLSRKTEITDHKEVGFSGYFTALGGKYTTSRNLAEKVVDKVCEVLGKGLPCTTSSTPLYSGNFSDLPTLIKDLKIRHSKLSDKKAFNLCSRYGSLAYEIAELGRDNLKNTTKPIFNSQSEEYYPEEIDYISRLEDVVYLSDFYFRRSGIGNIGKPSSDMFRSINSIVSASIKREINKVEIDNLLQRYEF